MPHALLLTGLIGGVSLLYATAGQAGGTAFLAVMTFAAVPDAQMRPTVLLLNSVAAGYAAWRLRHQASTDRKLLLSVTIPSLITAFAGGLIVLAGQASSVLTGGLLLFAGGLMIFKRSAETLEIRPIQRMKAAMVGAASGFVSGLTGVGGGVFLTPMLIAFGWASPRRSAQLSPPFILCNSAMGLAGVLLAGQMPAPGTSLYAIGALAGALAGTAIGHRWMSERGTRYVLAATLLFAGFRLVLR
jgi:uncharacterized membrane protein YfcA